MYYQSVPDLTPGEIHAREVAYLATGAYERYVWNLTYLDDAAKKEDIPTREQCLGRVCASGEEMASKLDEAARFFGGQIDGSFPPALPRYLRLLAQAFALFRSVDANNVEATMMALPSREEIDTFLAGPAGDWVKTTMGGMPNPQLVSYLAARRRRHISRQDR